MRTAALVLLLFVACARAELLHLAVAVDGISHDVTFEGSTSPETIAARFRIEACPKLNVEAHCGALVAAAHKLQHEWRAREVEQSGDARAPSISVLLVPPWHLQPSLGDNAIISGTVMALLRRPDVRSVDVLHFGPETAYRRFYAPPYLEGARLVRFPRGFCHTPGCRGDDELTDASEAAFVAELAQRGYAEVYFSPTDTLDGYYNCVHSQLQLRRARAASAVVSRVRLLGFSFDPTKAAAHCAEAVALLRMLPPCVSLCARDTPTMRSVEQIAPHAALRLVSDVAFTLPAATETELVRSAGAWVQAKRREGHIVLVVNPSIHPSAALGLAEDGAEFDARRDGATVSAEVTIDGHTVVATLPLARGRDAASVASHLAPFCAKHGLGPADCVAVSSHLEAKREEERRQRRRGVLAARLASELDALATHLATETSALYAGRKLALLFMPHDFRASQNDALASAAVLQHLSPTLRAASRLLADAPYRAAEAKALCKHADLAFTGRMHLAIACLSSGTPTAMIAHQNKYDGLLHHFGFSAQEMLVRSDHVMERGRIFNLLRALASAERLAMIRRTIAAELPRVQRLSASAFAWGDEGARNTNACAAQFSAAKSALPETVGSASPRAAAAVLAPLGSAATGGATPVVWALSAALPRGLEGWGGDVLFALATAVMLYAAVSPAQSLSERKAFLRLTWLAASTHSIYCMLELPSLLSDTGLFPSRASVDELSWETVVKTPSIFLLSSSFAAIFGVELTRFLSALAMLLFAAPTRRGTRGARCAVLQRARRAIPSWLEPVCMLFHVVALVSMQNISGPFRTSHGPAILLEMSYIALFVAANDAMPQSVLRAASASLAFRVMFGCGLAKLNTSWIKCGYRHCQLVAFPAHLESQEMGTRAAWWQFQLPLSVHRATTLATLLVELVAPFALFIGTPKQQHALIGLQMLLMVGVLATGCFGIFPFVVFCLLAFHARVAQRRTRGGDESHEAPKRRAKKRRRCGVRLRFIVGVAFVCATTLLAARDNVVHRLLLPPGARDSVDELNRRLGLTGVYGVFSKIRREQVELVVEGSSDGGGGWEAYPWSLLPSTGAAPRFVGPFAFGFLERLVRNELGIWPQPGAALATFPPWFACLLRRVVLAPQTRGSLPFGLQHNAFARKNHTLLRVRMRRLRFTLSNEPSASVAPWWREDASIELVAPIAADTIVATVGDICGSPTALSPPPKGIQTIVEGGAWVAAAPFLAALSAAVAWVAI